MKPADTVLKYIFPYVTFWQLQCDISCVFLRTNSYYLYGSVIPVTESKQHEFKTGGGAYPMTILPKVWRIS